MRFLTCLHQGKPTLAALNGEAIHSTSSTHDLATLLTAGPEALASAHAHLLTGPELDPATLTYLPPITNPARIICVGINYVDHATETGFQAPAYPVLFSRFASSLIGHQAPIVRPNASNDLDYEGELVAVIGKPGRDIPAERALEHIAGYSIFNDASIRDFQFKSSQWMVGKNFDATGAFGPHFVTADELPTGAKGLRLRTRLNGETLQDANTSDMIFDVATQVALLSQVMTLQPGDVLVTGTPSGVGLAREPKLYMKPGDRCEIEIEGIGTLSNPVIQQS